MPEAGGRAPSSEDTPVTAIAAAGDAWIVQATRGGTAVAASADATRALEAAALAREGDDARLAGQHERARELDLLALERAPRHPEIARRIAEIDHHAGSRAEAAILTLREAERDPDLRLGLLAGELLVEAGDTKGAVAALARAGEEEDAPSLASAAYARAAELTPDPLDALLWLDLAVARAPDAEHARWARVTRRLALGRLEDALGDVEHLEALAHGARAKHAVWRRAGDAWNRAGLGREATRLYERALRYVPEDATALAGLGAALVAEGRAARGAALLARAIDRAEASRAPTGEMLVRLGRALAEDLGDRPAAIARARAVPNDAPEALVARGLEGRWRAALGDLSGAALAFARMRDLCDALDPAPLGARDERAASAEAAALLVEAASLEERTGDLAAAQRHLASALRLRPRDHDIERAYRAICARALAPSASPTGEDEARIEELTRALQAKPDDDAVVDELATRLARLGRTLELFALLSARLDEAPPERRARLVPRQRAVLERLEAEARAAGRTAEANLFRDALAALR
jgi:tetratricopeptide (TPR) repeat protein